MFLVFTSSLYLVAGYIIFGSSLYVVMGVTAVLSEAERAVVEILRERWQEHGEGDRARLGPMRCG